MHRNALVNKDYMRSMEHEDRKQARLGFKCTDDTLPLSRRYIPIVRAYIRRFAKTEDDGHHPTRWAQLLERADCPAIKQWRHGLLGVT